MRKISSKLTLLLALASLVPLLTFGLLSLTTSRQTASKLAADRNQKVAQRAAEEIALYLDTSTRILKALAANINRTNLSPWQKESILKDYVLEFREFRTIHLIDLRGNVLQTSSIRRNPQVQKDEALFAALESQSSYRSGVFITEELIPTISLGFPVEEKGSYKGMVLGIVNLMDVWRVVDNIKVGQQGFAMVVSESGTLLAHGDPKLKPLVIEQKVLDSHPLVGEARGAHQGPVTYQDQRGTNILSVGVSVPGTDWALYIEQPLEEAFVDAQTMTRRLSIFIVLFTALACVVGFVGGRRYIIQPINKLITTTRAFARGVWEQRVDITSRDEFGELGAAFNSLASDLGLLKEDIQRKEREATIGRIASGLVHDLKHPIKNIENMVGLSDRLFDDEEYRRTFKNTVHRELETLNSYFENLADVSRAKPLQRVELDLTSTISSLCDEFQLLASSRGIELLRNFPEEPQPVLADPQALKRIFSNLMTNAVEAMSEEGTVTVTVSPRDASDRGNPRMVEVEIEDTGPGIAPDVQEQIFEPFVSTKRKGLGLGLSIAKKLTESHGGNITIRSSEGRGTAFIVAIPLLNQ